MPFAPGVAIMRCAYSFPSLENLRKRREYHAEN
jgi:hypothetical protein